MRGTFINRILPIALAVLVLAGAIALTQTRHSIRLTAGNSARPPAAAAVSGVLRACPAPGLAGSPPARVALVAASGSPAGPAGAGKAVVSQFGDASGPPLLSVSQPGSLTITKVKPARGHAAASSPAPSGQTPPAVSARGGVMIEATGSMARGLEAEQISGNGKAATRCDSPGTDFWFTGPGRFTVAHIQLYLMNPGSQPADVNVEAFTDAGPLQGSTDTGVAVAPHGMVVQSLDTMLKGSRVIALHVRTSVGQVTAALHESTLRTGGGAWLPAAQPPAAKVVLPGLPDTTGTRQLFVAVPGTQDAHITLTAVTTHGSYEPTGGSGLDIPGGSSVEISLPSMAGIPGSIRVSSNVPVTASVMLPGGPRGAPGVFTAACPPVQQQGVVAASQAGKREIAELELVAPVHAVRARIVELGMGTAGHIPAAGAGKVVQVGARRALVVPLSRMPGTPKGSPFAVVVTPLAGSGPLYAGRVLMAGGTLQSIVPVQSALTTVPLPTVRDAPVTPGS